jgi:hypothetical protein
MDEMPKMRHPFVVEFSEVIGADKIDRHRAKEFDDMPDFSGDPQDIVLYKINIKDGVYDQYDDQSTDPPCPLGFIQDHEPD